MTSELVTSTLWHRLVAATHLQNMGIWHLLLLVGGIAKQLVIKEKWAVRCGASDFVRVEG